jgi:hypothetical protein
MIENIHRAEDPAWRESSPTRSESAARRA